MIERALTYAGAVLLALLLAHGIAYHVGQMQSAVAHRWQAVAGAVLR
jgi:hypothetical protein